MSEEVNQLEKKILNAAEEKALDNAWRLARKMEKQGWLTSSDAVEKQVNNIMNFSEKAFESFERAIDDSISKADKLDEAFEIKKVEKPKETEKLQNDIVAERFKNTIELISEIVAYYRKALEIKEKEVQFLKDESSLLRGRIDLLSDTLAGYADGVEEFVVTKAIPKATTVEEMDTFDTFKALFDSPRSVHEDRSIKDQERRRHNILAGSVGPFTRPRHE